MSQEICLVCGEDSVRVESEELCASRRAGERWARKEAGAVRASFLSHMQDLSGITDLSVPADFSIITMSISERNDTRLP
jgi:hypothetical protein